MSGHPMPTFWLVWNENGRAPTKKHSSESAAEAEAHRLATQHPGDSFTVLQPITRITKRTVEIERFERDGVPF